MCVKPEASDGVTVEGMAALMKAVASSAAMVEVSVRIEGSRCWLIMCRRKSECRTRADASHGGSDGIIKSEEQLAHLKKNGSMASQARCA